MRYKLLCMILLGLVFPCITFAAPSFVQSKANKVWDGSSVSMTFDSNVTQGNVIVFSVKWESSAVALMNVAATCGNVNLTLVDNPMTYSATKVAAQGYGIVSNAGICTVTANFSGPAGGWVYIAAHEVAGIDTNNPLDGHTFNKQDDVGIGAEAITSGIITTASAGDYIFGVVWEGGSNGPTYTAASEFNKRISADSTTGGGATEDSIQTAAGSIAAKFTQSIGWADSISGVMAFRASGTQTQSPPSEPPPVVPPPPATSGSTVTAASCSQNDVQAAITAAADGDTVLIPAGSCTWTSRPGMNRCDSASVCINDKNVTLRGAGIDQTIISDETGVAWNQSAFYINDATKSFRITNFTLKGAGAAPESISVRKESNVNTPTRDWRIDHVKFAFTGNPATAVGIWNNNYGVFDHNQIISDSGLIQGIVVSPYVDGETYLGDTRWISAPSFGSSDAVYIEDNTYEYGASISDAVDSNNGARVVFRKNTVKNTYAANHGPGQATGRGTQLMEVYNNTFTATVPQWVAINFRSGTGIAFNNIMTGSYSSPDMTVDNPRTTCGDPDACNGTPPISSRCDGTQPIDGNLSGQMGYPCLDQIGYGFGTPGSETPMPLYEWNNIQNGNPIHFKVKNGTNIKPPNETDHIKENRDFFNGTIKPSYKPYTYPHPVVLDPQMEEQVRNQMQPMVYR